MYNPRFPILAAQTAPPMSSSHSYTIVATPQDDDIDDSDICPVCDGECTCHKASTIVHPPQTFAPKPPGVPLSMAELSLRYAAGASTPTINQTSSSSGRYTPRRSTPPSPPTSVTSLASPSPPPPTPKHHKHYQRENEKEKEKDPQQPKPSLKIKLTVPPGLLAKQRPSPSPALSSASSVGAAPQYHHSQPQSQHASAPKHQHAGKSYKHLGATISDFGTVGYGNPASRQASQSQQPKKRGRPPKASSSGLAATASQNVVATPTSTTSFGFSAKKLPPNLKFKSKSKSYQAHTGIPTSGKTITTAAASKTQKRSSSSSAPNRVRQTFKSRVSGKKTANRRRRRVLDSSDESSSPSEFSDIDMLDVRRGGVIYDYEDDMTSLPLPTFVPASAVASSNSSSSSSSSSLSELDSDDDESIEAEEENFIVADVHDKARLKRELLLDGNNNHKKRNGGGDWVIRPRKKSVGPDDVEMDVDSDATEDEDDEEEEEEADGEADEPDEGETEEDVAMSGLPSQSLPSSGFEEDEETTTDDQRRRYRHAEEGYSDEDDESSFDADLFFANLYGGSDSDSSDGGADDDDLSSDEDGSTDRSSTPFALRTVHVGGSMGEEGDQSDISCFSECTERFIGGAEFEVTEGWDGGIVFTNGIEQDRGLVDLEFEADASRYDGGLGSRTSSVLGDDEREDGRRRRKGKRHGKKRSARKMTGMGLGMDMGLGGLGLDDHHGESGRDAGDMSEGGYEEGDDGEGEGDTTDEELVGEDELPNERAMRLFSLPMSVSAINPLSTMSSPVVSPGRRRKEDEQSRERRRRRWGSESGPSALDILEGRVTFWDSDEMEFDEEDDEYEYESLASVASAALAGGGGVGGGGKGMSALSGALFSRGRRGSSERASSEVKRGPRKGVFVASTETRQAVIGDDKKGADVPSPHPRFNRGRKKHITVENLLRRHLLHSLSASISSTASEALLSPSGDAIAPNEQSPLELLLSSAAAAAAAAANGSEDPMAQQRQQQETEPIQLDDVLEASFLDDPEPNANAMDTTNDGGNSAVDGSGPAGSSSAASREMDEEPPSVKNLSRWDVISVGAFRQVRENAWEAGRHLHTPGSSVDLGSVIKSSPLSSMVWQNAAGAAATAAASNGGASSSSSRPRGSNRNGAGVASSSSASGPLLPSMFKSGVAGAMRSNSSSSKLAKRRRLMMGGSTMSSPLILPLGSSSLSSSAQTTPNGSSTNLLSDKMHYLQQQQQQNQQQQQQQQKSRKELRRERKLMKKKTMSHGYAMPHGTHQHHGHQYHTHHGHHPNSKMRSVASAQRSAGFGGGAGGSVPPLNL